MDFSIIIPTCNRIDVLTLCLDSLAHYFTKDEPVFDRYSIEVIVTADGRVDHLAQLLDLKYPWCRYVKGPSMGPAANRNFGASFAVGEWLIFLDDDCIVQPGWIESYANCALFGGVLEGRTSSIGEKSRFDMDCPINESGGHLWSCNFAIRRSDFIYIGMFNTSFKYPAMEDVELKCRLDKADIPIFFVYDALVLHPWRVRNGRLYSSRHANSVAIFVALHPEMHTEFSLQAQLRKVLFSLKYNVIHSVRRPFAPGKLRMLFLDLYSHILTYLAVRRLKW